MGTIRDRMIGDLRLRGYAEQTRRVYVSYARKFVAYFMKSPIELQEEDVRTFLLSLVDGGKSAAVVKMYTAAVRFLYQVTLKKPEIVAELRYPKVPIRLPEILSGTEALQLFGAMRSLKHRVAAVTIYAAGLRVSEVCRLEVDDIDSKRMVLRVRCGKGARDRYTMLSVQLLEILRGYWRAERPQSAFLFPSRQDPHKPMSTTSLRTAVRKAAKAAGLTKKVTPHTLRHTFATHMLTMGADIRQIQLVLGHRSIQTTARYTQMSRRHIAALGSPLDVLGTEEASMFG